MGDFKISFYCFFWSFFIFLLMMYVIKPSKKEASRVNFIWLASLFIAIAFATKNVRIYQNSWHADDSKRFIQTWYNMSIRQLKSNMIIATHRMERAQVLKLESFPKDTEVVNWYKKQVISLESSKDTITQSFDIKLWQNSYEVLCEFVDTEDSQHLQFYNYLIGDINNVNSEFSALANYQKEKKLSSFEQFLFLVYPWFLAIILGLRFSKEVYEYYFL